MLENWSILDEVEEYEKSVPIFGPPCTYYERYINVKHATVNIIKHNIYEPITQA